MWADLTQNWTSKGPELVPPDNNEDHCDQPAAEDDPQIVDKTQCEIPDSYTREGSRPSSMK
jgi:hypothetical protein